MIIGFSGAAGSGKTTLVNEVAKVLRSKGYNVSTVINTAREVLETYRKHLGIKDLKEIREKKLLDFQLSCLIHQTWKEYCAKNQSEIVLADRTIYDHLFYLLFYYRPNNNTVPLIEYFSTFNHFEKRGERYRLIFFCKAPESIKLDGVRDPDVLYTPVQESVIRMLLPDYYTVDWCPLEDRVKIVLSVLKDEGII
ncbi:hypothetical protein DRP04_11985 [Archaeoglobales archaeon]|nr:MAG: hypothetical protein DRP04_11985 [Archaeoglobales archaeon]